MHTYIQNHIHVKIRKEIHVSFHQRQIYQLLLRFIDDIFIMWTKLESPLKLFMKELIKNSIP